VTLVIPLVIAFNSSIFGVIYCTIGTGGTSRTGGTGGTGGILEGIYH
jgi:hypothetical protein